MRNGIIGNVGFEAKIRTDQELEFRAGRRSGFKGSGRACKLIELSEKPDIFVAKSRRGGRKTHCYLFGLAGDADAKRADVTGVHHSGESANGRQKPKRQMLINGLNIRLAFLEFDFFGNPVFEIQIGFKIFHFSHDQVFQADRPDFGIMQIVDPVGQITENILDLGDIVNHRRKDWRFRHLVLQNLTANLDNRQWITDVVNYAGNHLNERKNFVIQEIRRLVFRKTGYVGIHRSVSWPPI